MTRRTFFFLGFGILKGKVLYELTPKILLPPPIKPFTALDALIGIPYHQTNASTGAWLGITRLSQPVKKELLDIINLMDKNRWDP